MFASHIETLKNTSNIDKLIHVLEIPNDNQDKYNIGYLEYNQNDVQKPKSDNMLVFHLIANSGNSDEYTKYIESKKLEWQDYYKKTHLKAKVKEISICTNEVKITENNILDSLNRKITEDVISTLFEAGWNSHYDIYSEEGFTLNITAKSNKEYKNTKTYYSKEIAVPQYSDYGGKFPEFDQDGNEIIIDYRLIGSKMLVASNIINEKNNNDGGANFVVCNTRVIEDISKIKNFEKNPDFNSNDLLSSYGVLAGINVYVCNLLDVDDTRVLVGRKGIDVEQSLKLLVQNLYYKVENNILYSKYNLEKIDEPNWKNMYFTFYIQY